MLNDRSVDRYLGRIVEKLAAVAPGARYPYQIKAVNASEINAFADHVIYALCIVPGRDYDSLARTFSQMMRTLRVNDEAAHRGARTLEPGGVRRGGS